MLQIGDRIPDFVLKTFEGDEVTPQSLAGRRVLLCFYPFAFSGVCTEQLGVYQQNIGLFNDREVEIVAVSVDSHHVQNAFKKSLDAADITFCTDFEPKGEVARAFGVFRDDGFNDRTVFLIEPDGTIGWAKKMPVPGEFPDAPEVLAAIDAAS